MTGFEAGRCPNCREPLVSADGPKGHILEILKHVKGCPALKPEERQAVIEMTLALLELLRATGSSP